MHSRGLKLGIYEDIGTETCEGYPGSWQHFQADSETFASWKVDYLKLDGCNLDATLMPKGRRMGDARGMDFLEGDLQATSTWARS